MVTRWFFSTIELIELGKCLRPSQSQVLTNLMAGVICRALKFVCFTNYEKEIPADVAFLPDFVENTLGQVICQAGMKQLRIAETEKYAHVTYFFNGGIEEKSEGEEHCLVSSPQVSSYDMKPEMSALQITDKLIAAIEEDRFDFILINYANADMVGHTGNISGRR
jgi:2,3-bisphosphoglycerate-independent phosphoglycerate mutase